MNRAVALTYYGLSTFELAHDGARLLVDPWLEEPEWSQVALADFADVDAVFVTHGARDHLGDALEVAERSGARVVAEPAVVDHLVASGLPAERVDRVIWGNELAVAGVDVRVLETRHLSYFESPAAGRLSGLPVGFCFAFPDVTVYYLGDTAIFSDLELFGDLYEPDVALVPVGGAPGDRAPLPPAEAARVADWLGVDHVIPVHYVPASDEPDAFRRHLGEGYTDPPAVLELAVGESVALTD